MSSTIKPRRGTTTPTAGIVENELVVDTTNKRIYIGNVGGSGDLIGSSPGGSDTYVQFNDGGNYGGDVGLTYNKTTDAVTMLGDLNLNGGGIKTTQSSISLIPATATSVSLGLSATTLTLGGTSGTASIRNAALKLANTTGSITTNTSDTNHLTINPYGKTIIAPARSTTLGGSIPSITVENSDSAAGVIEISGGDVFIGRKTADDVSFDPVNIIFEGGVSDGFETTITVTNPTADRTVTIPDAGGTVAILGTGATTDGRIPYFDTTTNTLLGTTYMSYNDGTNTITLDAAFDVGSTIGTTNSTFNLVNVTATTINFGGAATSIIMGATTGTTQVRNNLQLNAQSDLRFADSDSSNYVAFQAPATVSSNVLWTLPSTDGSNGDVLTTNGSGTLSWAAGGGGSGITRSVNNISTTTSAGSTASTDYVYNVTSGTFTLTMPTAVSNTNRYTIKQSGTGVLTIATTSSQTIDGQSSYTIDAQYQSIDMISDGTNWIIV